MHVLLFAWRSTTFLLSKGWLAVRSGAAPLRRAHADLWRKVWFKIEDLGIRTSMRVVFELEDFIFDPSLAPAFFL